MLPKIAEITEQDSVQPKSEISVISVKDILADPMLRDQLTYEQVSQLTEEEFLEIFADTMLDENPEEPVTKKFRELRDKWAKIEPVN